MAVAATSLTVPAAAAESQTHAVPLSAAASAVDILRRPNLITAQFGPKEETQLQYAGHEWTCPGVRVVAEAVQHGQGLELPIVLAAPGGTLTRLHLRWEARGGDAVRVLGDAWERSYGDLAWRTTVPERVMPWYFLTFDGTTTNGYGVKTQPSTFCFWLRDTQGISLWIDLRNGGDAASLGTRELAACTVVTRAGVPGESITDASREFCKRMCPAPRLPKGALFGSNDWNYAYGANSAEGTLRDADLISSLAPRGRNRPYVVIDDGWQDKTRFPSLPDLAASIRSRELHPGIWVRPVRAQKTAPPNLLLPQARFGSNSHRNDLAFDPTNAEALHEITEQVSVPAGWGFEFIKHDFSTYELFGRWGFEMGPQVTLPGWHFQDQTRTNAEIVRDVYQAIRRAAGEDRVVLGCNTVGHLAAGIFESQRIGDDTSGRDWERTRRYGLNGLAQRIAQHRTFAYVDPDCAAITPDLDWRLASQWMDVVARSGTSLFLSPDPRSITPETKSAMRDAMAIASENAAGNPMCCTESTTPDAWEFQRPTRSERRYQWLAPGGASPALVS